MCWADDAATARKTVHEIWPNGGVTGQLAQDLPTWTHFEQASANVTEADATGGVPCGPDLEPFLEPFLDSVRSALDSGYDHLYFHQIGPDQAGFLDFWTRELQPALTDLASR